MIPRMTEKSKRPEGGRVFLITGASTGIGAATARHAAEAGYRVVLAARSAGRLDELVAVCGGPERALAVSCDVQDWRQQQAMVERALETFGRLDAVFANAGGSFGGGFVGGDDTPDEWLRMVTTNVYGAAATVRLCLPALIEARGHVVLTGSVAGRVATGSLYSATKWAVTGMAESIRKSVLETGVRVTLIGPGRVDTPFWDEPRSEGALRDVDVARTVLWALDQPPHVDVNEILVRPIGQPI
jgi:NADP-dependent 3-hydroxy acid dehydrogenase YdfG